jgi:hypothetical protein
VVFVGLLIRYLSAQNVRFRIFIAKTAIALDTLKALRLLPSRHLMLDPQLVRHHRDELAVRGLRLGDVDRVTEQMADRVDVAASPGDFDRMADGALDAGWRRLEFLGDRGIERFGDGY